MKKMIYGSILLLTGCLMNVKMGSAMEKSDIKPMDKLVVTDQLSGIKLYNNSNLESSKSIQPGVAYKVDGYRIINGKTYYRVYRNDYAGYILEDHVNTLKKKSKKQMVTTLSSNYKRYSNLFWKERGKSTKGYNYEMDGYYDLGSGKKYASLYRVDSKGKRGWYGYINMNALRDMTMVHDKRYMTIDNANYKRYSNFFGKVRGTSSRGTVFESPGYYIDGNNKRYYSLYRIDSKGKRGWYGYISQPALNVGKWCNGKLTLTIKNDNYTGWTNPYTNKKQASLHNLKGKKVSSSTYFDNGIGDKYYVVYYGQRKLGLINDDALQSNYYRTNPKIIRIKQNTGLYSDVNRKKHVGTAAKGEFYKVDKVILPSKNYPVLKLSNGRYITANSQYVAKTNGYQNPKQYYQVNYSQIKPYGTVGYNLGWGYMGVKTYMVCKKLGVYNGYNFMGDAQINAIKNFQRRHGLTANGWVDKKTWMKLGFSESSWTSIDSYVAPLQAHAWDGRKKHIEAMIDQAYKYLGNKYLEGASSSPSYGVDCSGLVMQALYAGGINPAPISSINHAHPGNEYNSRNLWASSKLKRVPYAERQRGDLIFYYQPGTTTIWHVAIYLGNDKVIESWPPKVVVWPIKNSQRNVIAGVKRPFI